MSNEKHTQGKWEWEANEKGVFIKTEGKTVADKGMVIAQVALFNGRTQANAERIVKAVNLLSFMENYLKENDDRYFSIKQLLDKAEGK